MKRAIVLLAKGFEEIEAITVIDILRRAGIETTTVSINSGKMVQGAHNVSIQTNSQLNLELEKEFDVIVLPGGQPGASNLKASIQVGEFLRKERKNTLIAAICAAPTVLHSAGILKDHKVTSYPTDKEVFDQKNYREDVTVYDPPFLTSRGVGTAIPFGLKIVELLMGENKALGVGEKILFYK